MLKLVNGATLQGIKYPMRKVLVNVEIQWKQLDEDDVTVTCGTNGEHSVRSYHYYGYAIDFRTWEFTRDQVLAIKQKLKKDLGYYYDVVVHKDSHLHIEFDVERYRAHMKSLDKEQLVTSF